MSRTMTRSANPPILGTEPLGCEAVETVCLAHVGDTLRFTSWNGWQHSAVVGTQLRWKNEPDGPILVTLNGSVMGGECDATARIERKNARGRYESVVDAP